MRKSNFMLLVAAASMSWCGMAHALEPLKESNEAHREASIDRFLSKADKNGNGTFEIKEDDKQWKRNSRLDKNSDGVVTKDESTAFHNKRFKKMDVNGDEQLTKDEVKAFHKKHKKHKKHHEDHAEDHSDSSGYPQ